MTDIHDMKLGEIERVEFFKRDEVTTDLICCELITDKRTFLYDEEWSGWPALLANLEGLDGFRKDWFSLVSQPAFAERRFVAFEKAP